MHPIDAVGAFLRSRQITGRHITAALSGGADSVCLLYCLLHWKEELGLEIAALHVQHGLRGEESMRDEQFCRSLCDQLHVPLTVVPVDVGAYREENHCSVEEAARELRYRAFREHSPGLCATAHTASDNFETMLFRLARGTGLRGLCGIPPERGGYIRPLLTVSRQEVEAFLRERSLTFVTDSSNLGDAYTRNLLRHHAVPVLKRQNPSLEETAVRTAESLRCDEDYLETAAGEAFARAMRPDGAAEGLSVLHPAIRRRCIRLFLMQAGLRADTANTAVIEKLLGTGGSAELVRGGIRACVSHDVLFLQEPKTEPDAQCLHPGMNRLLPGYVLTAAAADRKNILESAIIHTMFANSALDYDIIKGSAMLHGRKPGLRIRTAGSTHTTVVKKWLQTLDPVQRQSVHYLSDSEGLLWVQGLGTAARAAVTERTQRILFVCVHQTNT